MLNMSLAEISEKAAGELQGADAWVYGAAIDSRKVLDKTGKVMYTGVGGTQDVDAAVRKAM